MLHPHVSDRSCLMIEGNIGIGKSTFLRVIGERLPVIPIYEPTQRWQHIGGGENLLDLFYKDIPRWAYTFQTYAFVTRVVDQEEYARKYPGKVQLLERSVFADRYCFARNCYEMGLMTKLEWDLYREWFSWLVETYTVKPRGFIYLRAEPEVCYERMTKRNRAAESSVSLEYLKKLHDRHEEWLINKKDIAPYLQDVPVITLDCNVDFEHDTQQQEKHVEALLKFFEFLQPQQYQHSSDTARVVQF
jgi:deoxyadenosine/deoxycytidine kinase